MTVRAIRSRVTAGVAPFNSGSMEEDTERGTYKYVCKFHEAMGMVGTVVVS
ncbi:plastocyanin/azurin family copper-binding protein [Bradyrhizobium sp. CB82]|uniref:plastocyanin/azurin family copper-binding protein n=1 Tax=Bradyrhizobium sp. CB82 TaxID=3039159 RepID=UPI0024B0E53C|nr:plastocyanin/azurin family copper-binding protein [Bradyrhizobium sp. CB82]WFU40205.1 plastocyanin/azurin family copper-binding protein [Bradyrhizobium sp. CB82]